MDSPTGQPPERPKPPERPERPMGDPPPGRPKPPDTPKAAEPPKVPGPPKAGGPGGGQKSVRERIREPRVAAAIGIALAVLIILVLVLGGGDDDGGSGSDVGTEPKEASVDDLREVADSAANPIYWIGEQDGKTYELTVSEEGNVFIRYLDPDVEVGSRDVASLTVGTYPVKDAYGALRKIARRPGSVVDETPDGGLVVAGKDNPSSVYIAYPGADYQIEVYDPDPAVALETATSGAVEPVD
jgi:hypothetical protein